MTDGTTSTTADPTVDQYGEFISQIELSRIWLVSARITNDTKGNTPASANVNIDSSCKWELTETGFTVIDKYVVEFTHGKKRLGRIEVQFGLDYGSEMQMTEGIFALFGVNNLPLNSWPYAREFLSSAVSRMQWLPFTLPARHIIPDESVPAPDDDEG